ncbi:MAG: hypothetical protein ACKOPO_11345 [Novosphingobium sp.]
MSASSSGEGVEYGLPTGEFMLDITEVQGFVTASISGPIAAKDGKAVYRTKLLSSGIATNDFTINVNANGLLTGFSGSSEGKLTELAKSLATTIAFQAGDAATPPFYSARFRLDDMPAAVAAANNAIGLRLASVCSEKDAKGKQVAACKTMKRVLGAAPANFLALSYADVEGTEGVKVTPRKTPEPGSNVLFYRPLRSVRVTMSLANGSSQTKFFHIPDERRTNWIAIPGGVFAKQEYNLTFSDGVLTSYHRIARNEAAGAIALPVDVVKAVVTAPFSALSTRKDGLVAQAEYLKKVTELENAAKEAQKACASARTACQDLPIQVLSLTTDPASAPSPAAPSSPSPSPSPTGSGNGNGNV